MIIVTPQVEMGEGKRETADEVDDSRMWKGNRLIRKEITGFVGNFFRVG